MGWIVLAAALYGLGCITALTTEWKAEVMNVYAHGHKSIQGGGASPMQMLTTKPWSMYPDWGGRYAKGVWIEYCMLDVLGVVYAAVLVVALAAAVPRTQVWGLTAAGAGALAVYFSQGFLMPAVAPLGNRAMIYAFGAAGLGLDGGMGSWRIVACVLALSLLYSFAVARIVSAMLRGARRQPWWLGVLLLVLLVVAADARAAQLGAEVEKVTADKARLAKKVDAVRAAFERRVRSERGRGGGVHGGVHGHRA